MNSTTFSHPFRRLMRPLLKLSFALFIQLQLMAFTSTGVQAQCDFFQAFCPFPNSLGICDLSFPAPVTVEHFYPTDHAFNIVITFNPDHFNLTTTDVLTNVSFGTDGAGNTVVSGTFLVPFNPVAEGAQSSAILNLAFDLVSSYSGIDDDLTVSIFDPSCGSTPVEFLDPAITIFPDFADLRPWTQTSMTTLILLDIFDNCPAPGCTWFTHALVDNLDIDTNYAFDWTGFTGRGLIAFLPGGKITVKSGFQLVLNNIDVFTCGDQLAQGIIVEPGATLEMNNCNISDCRIAIDAKPGCTLKIKDCNFISNYIGVDFDMSSAAEADKRVTLGKFQNNSFSTVHNLKQPFPGMSEQVETRGYCGIRVTDYRDFNVWGGTQFNRLANGLLIKWSTFNIGEMFFDNMHGDGTIYPLEGYGIHMYGRNTRSYWGHVNEFWLNMTFNNCETGIYAFDYTASVDNTLMTNVDIGIDWSGSTNEEVKLRKNNITARKYGIRSYKNEPLAYGEMKENKITITDPMGGLNPVTGIEMQESPIGSNINGWKVKDNNIKMNQGGRGILYRSGVGGLLEANVINGLSQTNDFSGLMTDGSQFSIFTRNNINGGGSSGLGATYGIYSAAGTANIFSCNCVDNTNIGLQFKDIADFTNNVKGNNLNHHVVGLQIGDVNDHVARIGLQVNTGNRWDLLSIGLGQFGALNHANINQSRFYVNGQMGSSNEHPPVNPAPGWFLGNLQTSYYCSNGCATGLPLPLASPEETPQEEINTTDLAVMDQAVGQDVNLIWKEKYRLLGKILRKPSVMKANHSLNQFYESTKNQTIGKLAILSHEMSNLYDLPTDIKQTSDQLRQTIAQKAEALRSLDSLVQTGASISDQTYAALRIEKAGYEKQYETFIQEYEAVSRKKARLLLNSNASIHASTVFEINQKFINQMLLQMAAGEVETPSGADLNMLVSIAEQCPISGGDAVYVARSIAERLLGRTFDDQTACEATDRSESGITASASGNTAILIYPNPATTTINWSGVTGAVSVKIFDQMGKLVQEQTVDSAQLELDNLPVGLYSVQLFDQAGTTLATSKISVIK